MVLLLYTLHLSGNLARFLNNLVAPQVDVPNLGRLLQARPQEPPEVYSNLLPPSVGETTGGIHPHAVRHKYLSPTGGKCPLLLGGIMQAHPQEPPEVYSNPHPPWRR